METEELNKTNKDDFILWLNKKYSSQKVLSFLSVVEEVELFYRKTNILNQNLFGVNDLKKFDKIKLSINGNRFFKNNHKGKMVAILGLLSEYNKYLIEKLTIKIDENDIGIEKSNDIDVAEKETLRYFVVKFNEKESYSYTKPILYRYKSKIYDISNWCNLYIENCKSIIEEHKEIIMNLKGKSLNSENGRMDFCGETEKHIMIKPRLIFENLYVETNLSADQIIDKIKRIISLCNESLESIEIRYIKTKDIEKTKKNNDSLYVFSANVQTEFLRWMTEVDKNAEATSRSYSSAIKTISEYGKEWGIIEKSLFDISDKGLLYKVIYDILFKDERFIKLNIEQHHRFKAALKKYHTFISGGFELETIDKKELINQNVDKYATLLATKFKNGFRINSVLETKKILKVYESEFSELPLEKDEEIQKIMQRIGIEYEGRIYSPASMIEEDIKSDIFEYIENLFKSEISLIYYDSIYKEFENYFHTSNIYNIDMLKLYLEYFLKDKYNVVGKYISKSKSIKANPLEEIRSFMRNCGSVVCCEYIEENLPQIPINRIKQIFSLYTEFIYVKKDTYIHIDNVHLSKEDIDNIKSIINNTVEKDGFISGNELITTITKIYPKIIEKNSQISDSVVALRDSIKHYLADTFSFNGNIISVASSNLTMSDIFAEYCKRNEIFTIEMLNVLKNELGTTIYFDAVYDNSVRINENEFVSKNKVSFDVNAIDKVISAYCTGDYITIISIEQFALFPGIHYPWNSYLLEHYVYAYSTEFKLLHSATFTATKCSGVIVKRNSKFSTFEDVISDAVAKSDVELDRKKALDFLYSKGFIGKRNLSNIDKVIENTKLARNY